MILKSFIRSLVLLSSILVLTELVRAQDSLLVDQNGDGTISCLAFGDSITYGLGDNIAPGVTVDPFPIRAGGYPVRISQAAGIPVVNAGVPGEFFTQEGIDRLPSTILRSDADIVLVMEGANDSFLHQNTSDYEVKMQKAVNVITALGRQPVLATLPSPCCNHAGAAPFMDSYSSAVTYIGALNQVPVVDIKRVWRTTCAGGQECDLFNLPDGLHPNTRGYDAMAQAFLAVLYGIDVFSAEGPVQLEQALALPEGSVFIKPGA